MRSIARWTKSSHLYTSGARLRSQRLVATTFWQLPEILRQQASLYTTQALAVADKAQDSDRLEDTLLKQKIRPAKAPFVFTKKKKVSRRIKRQGLYTAEDPPLWSGGASSTEVSKFLKPSTGVRPRPLTDDSTSRTSRRRSKGVATVAKHGTASDEVDSTPVSVTQEVAGREDSRTVASQSVDDLAWTPSRQHDEHTSESARGPGGVENPLTNNNGESASPQPVATCEEVKHIPEKGAAIANGLTDQAISGGDHPEVTIPPRPKLKNIVEWKRVFPDASARQNVQIPIKAVIGCQGIGFKGYKMYKTEYHAILRSLNDISETTEPAARDAAVKDLWRKTRQFVVDSVPALENHTSALQADLSSAINVQRNEQELRRHQSSLSGVQRFFAAYSDVTGEPFEWDSIWMRLSGSAAPAASALAACEDGQDIQADAPYSSDLASSESPLKGEATSQQVLASKAVPSDYTIRSLFDWKRLDLSKQEAQQIQLFVDIFIFFRYHGFGSPTDLANPLHLLKLLQTTTLAKDRAATIRRLASHTQNFVRRHQEQLRAKHKRVFSRINYDGNGSAMIMPNYDHLGYRVSSLHLAFKRTNEFLTVYDTESALPEEDEGLAEHRSVPDPLTVNVGSNQGFGVSEKPDTHKKRKFVEPVKWKTMSMTKGELKEMSLLVPIYLSYRQAGISESGHFKKLPHILSEFDNASSAEERNAKIQALVVFTRKVLDDHESEIFDNLSTHQKLAERSDQPKEKLLLKNKINHVKHAIALTVRFRTKYTISDQESRSDTGATLGNFAVIPAEKHTALDAHRDARSLRQDKHAKASASKEEVKDTVGAQSLTGALRVESPDARTNMPSPPGPESRRDTKSAGPANDRILQKLKMTRETENTVLRHRPPRATSTVILRHVEQHAGQLAAGLVASRMSVDQQSNKRASEVPPKTVSEAALASVKNGKLSSHISKRGVTHTDILPLAFTSLTNLLDLKQEHKYAASAPSSLRAASTDPENAFQRIATAAASWLCRPGTADKSNQLENLAVDTGAREIPITDWNAMGYQDFGHWLEERLRRVERREAAHIVHLLTTTHAGIYGDEGLSDLWRDEFKQDLTKQYNDLRLYDDEVKDPRIKVHLEDINPPDNETSISGTIKWQRIQARRVHTRLKHDASALDATTDGSFRTTGYGPTTAGIDVTIQSIHPISEHCEMGTIVRTTNEAELSALLRGLQVVRDIFQDRGESREFRQYRRIIIATNSIMSLQSLIGSGAAYRQTQSELQRTTRLAALCRMQAYGILEAQKDIESIHFIWLPKLS